MVPKKRLRFEHSSGHSSQEDASDQALPPARRRTRHSGATRLAGSDSEAETDYPTLGFTVPPEAMDASKITAYINLLPEYTQYMDLYELATTNDEDCRHHLDILRNWRQLRYHGDTPLFAFISGRPKRPARPASLGPSSLKLRTRAVITYKHLVDDAKSSGFPAIKQAAWVKLYFDYLVICYVHLDDASIFDRIPDHQKLFRLAAGKMSKEQHVHRALPQATLTRPGPLLHEQPDGPVVAIEELVMKPDGFTNVPDWDQIVGNHGAKNALWESIMVRKRVPWIFKKTGSFLLFGPPGTGKTTMVKAMARSSNFACMEISSDFVRRKYFGQSEAVVGKIFDHAHTIQPCLIFIDEVEEILGKKGDSAISAEEGINAQFLKHMSALNDSGSQVWVVAATSKPWALSASMCRRFSSRIYVTLPEKNDALKLFKQHLKEIEARRTTSGLQPFTFDKGAVGQALDSLIGESFRHGQKRHFSGDDFVRAAQNIPRLLYKEIQASPVFVQPVIDNQTRIIQVKDPAEQGAFRKPVTEFSDGEWDILKFRAIGIADIEEALHSIQSVSTGSMIESFEEWDRDFGDGNKKKTRIPNPPRFMGRR